MLVEKCTTKGKISVKTRTPLGSEKGLRTWNNWRSWSHRYAITKSDIISTVHKSSLWRSISSAEKMLIHALGEPKEKTPIFMDIQSPFKLKNGDIDILTLTGSFSVLFHTIWTYSPYKILKILYKLVVDNDGNYIVSCVAIDRGKSINSIEKKKNEDFLEDQY